MARDEALRVAQAMAEPVRLAILERLVDGPATVADLVAHTGATQPNVSNHLAVLREANLVRAVREGRTAVYRLRGRDVSSLMRSLARVAGGAARRPSPSHPLAVARSCYDHPAGLLGVEVLDGLVRRHALEPPRGAGRDMGIGPRADEVFRSMGVDPGAAGGHRRHFAFGCPDWTERRPHLGGALGAALLERFEDAGWVERVPGTRALTVTDGGRRYLRRTLGVRLAQGPAGRSLS
jgi:DNA-binding transcriptional ArsR family regulator